MWSEVLQFSVPENGERAANHTSTGEQCFLVLQVFDRWSVVLVFSKSKSKRQASQCHRTVRTSDGKEKGNHLLVVDSKALFEIRNFTPDHLISHLSNTISDPADAMMVMVAGTSLSLSSSTRLLLACFIMTYWCLSRKRCCGFQSTRWCVSRAAASLHSTGRMTTSCYNQRTASPSSCLRHSSSIMVTPSSRVSTTISSMAAKKTSDEMTTTTTTG